MWLHIGRHFCPGPPEVLLEYQQDTAWGHTGLSHYPDNSCTNCARFQRTQIHIILFAQIRAYFRPMFIFGTAHCFDDWWPLLAHTVGTGWFAAGYAYCPGPIFRIAIIMQVTVPVIPVELLPMSNWQFHLVLTPLVPSLSSAVAVVSPGRQWREDGRSRGRVVAAVEDLRTPKFHMIWYNMSETNEYGYCIMGTISSVYYCIWSTCTA